VAGSRARAASRAGSRPLAASRPRSVVTVLTGRSIVSLSLRIVARQPRAKVGPCPGGRSQSARDGPATRDQRSPPGSRPDGSDAARRPRVKAWPDPSARLARKGGPSLNASITAGPASGPGPSRLNLKDWPAGPGLARAHSIGRLNLKDWPAGPGLARAHSLGRLNPKDWPAGPGLARAHSFGRPNLKDWPAGPGLARAYPIGRLNLKDWPAGPGLARAHSFGRNQEETQTRGYGSRTGRIGSQKSRHARPGNDADSADK
jgi:hypothetical protein